MLLNVPAGGLCSGFALGMLGRVDEGLAAVDSALEQVARPGWHERCVLSELQRVRGWLLEQQGATEAAEAGYLESLETARSQRARTHELRTATSYASLLQSLGRTQEAFGILQPVYDWFTEGFDTNDLEEARAMLDELEASA